MKGLEGIVAAETKLSFVDGKNGVLIFNGYDAAELAQERTFEEVASMLWTGRLPSEPEAFALHQRLASYRTLPVHVKNIIDMLPNDIDMMSVIRTALSSMSSKISWPPSVSQAEQFTAAIPTIIAYRNSQLRGVTPTHPEPAFHHAKNYLYMLNDGQIPEDSHVRALEAYLIITMEHGLNASTFTSRVITSTQSDMASALVGAIGAMKGPLHGGAPSEVMTMLEKISTTDRIEPWLRHELEQGNRLMGFGHRVYKTRDPRALALRTVVEQLQGNDSWFDFMLQVENTAVRLLQEFKPGRHLYANVEFFAASILQTIGLPSSLWTPTFTASRTVGWTAHILEQAANNRLIRPQAKYIGPPLN